MFNCSFNFFSYILIKIYFNVRRTRASRGYSLGQGADLLGGELAPRVGPLVRGCGGLRIIMPEDRRVNDGYAFRAYLDELQRDLDRSDTKQIKNTKSKYR